MPVLEYLLNYRATMLKNGTDVIIFNEKLIAPDIDNPTKLRKQHLQ